MAEAGLQDGRPIIAITPGDCTGIGPEQVARILADGRMAGIARLVAVGDRRVLDLGMSQAGVSFAVRHCDGPDDVDWSDPAVPLVDLANTDPARHPPGHVSAGSGRLTGETLAAATTPAHGTAFDIAGKGVADTGALETAIVLAAKLAARNRAA